MIDRYGESCSGFEQRDFRCVEVLRSDLVDKPSYLQVGTPQ